MKARSGMVYLVGAGPGDAQLLTLRGAELLRRADVVIYDALVNPDLARLARPGTEIIARSAERPFSQDELNALLRDRAEAGQCVVRLKGGDPYVFGRGGEEAEFLASARIRFEVIPGVSSINAAAVYAGIPITHRALASTVTVVTGHEDPDKSGRGVDWALLARTPGTKVILMGAERLGAIAAALREQGMAKNTPVAVTQSASLGRQRTVCGTLGDIAQRAVEAALSAPAVIVIGDVVGLRDRLNWAEERSLFGQRIVVTRAREQAAALAAPLRERGAEVLEVPCIKMAPPAQIEPLIEVIGGLGAYDWIVFTSANGVTAFFDYFFKAYDDVRAVGMVRIAAVGPVTAARLQELHLRVDLVPEEFVAPKIAAALAQLQSLENLRILLIRAEVARPELPRLLEDQGAIVDDIAAYRTVPDTEDWNGAAARLQAEGADWLTFASGSAARGFHDRFDLPTFVRAHPGLRLASIGPETTKVLRELGVQTHLEARVHTADGLIAALEKTVGSGRASRDPRMTGRQR